MRGKVLLGGVSMVALLGASALGAPAAGASFGAHTDALMTVPPQADPTARHGLADVSALSPDDAWAVGAHSVNNMANQTWARHWDGTRWTHVPTPDPGTASNGLNSVAAISPSDVWAVGTTMNVGDNDDSQLVEHWDGTSWSVVSPPAGPGRPSAVSASGPNDVWVVGDRYQDPIAEHYDGTSWTGTDLAVPDVTPPYVVTLILPYAVTTLSPTNAWVVGIYDAQNNDGGYNRELLVEHWNGTRWKVYPLPHQSEFTYLLSVSASARSDVWAVGMQDLSREQKPFFAHWDGATWTTSSQSYPGSHDYELRSVTAISSDDAWAVGSRGSRVLAEHWDGQQWSIDAGADPGARTSWLSGVDAVASDDVFAVGGRGVHSKVRGLAEGWNGTKWHQQP